MNQPVTQPARLALLTILAGVVRFAWLATPPPTFDEAWTWYLLELIRRGPEHWLPVGFGLDAPGFVGINFALTRWFGNDFGTLRLPPAVFATASVPLFYLLVCRLGAERLAWRAALLMAVSPFFVFYGKDARPYAQLLFACLVFTWIYVVTEGGERPWRRRALVAAATVFAVGSHYYALTYLAAFYAQRLWVHWRAGRRSAAVEAAVTGAVSLLAILPLLGLLAVSMAHISLPYWRSPVLNVVSVVSEHFLFTGAAGAGDDPNVAVLMLLQTIVVALLFVPVATRRWRGGALPDLHPILRNLWWVAPVLVQGHDLVSSRPAMFFPRGFIPSAPFLLTWWLAQCDAMPVRPWRRRAYMTLMLAPVVGFGYQTAICETKHAAFKNRDVVYQVVDQMRTVEGQFDVVVVHLWWAAQYIDYYYRGPARVEALGLPHRALAVDRGEMTAVLQSLQQLRPTDRLLLVENTLATGYVDSEGRVRAALDATRPRVAEIPCHPTLGREVGIICTHMVLYGPVGGAATR
jgi:Dolichyl-phosphate-mannose-protein mannosyltransferase